MPEAVNNHSLKELARTDSDMSQAFFNPRLIENILVSLIEEKGPYNHVLKSGLNLDVVGFSKESAGVISIDDLPPGGAQKLLRKFLSNIPEYESKAPGSPDEEKINPIPPAVIESILIDAQQIGGKLYSDTLGVFPEGMAANYRQILRTMEQREPSKIEYLEKKLDRAESWDVFKQNLLKNVKDERVLVWIRVETPPGTGQVAEQRLGYIIEKHLMPSSNQLKGILKEAWFEDRGKSFTLPVVANLPKDYFRVATSEIQILMHSGFMMTVVDNTWDLKADFYKAMGKKEIDSQASFVLDALSFSLAKNHALVKKLDLVYEELKVRLKPRKVKDIGTLEDQADLLKDSARELYFASDNYVTILTSGLRDDFFKSDELNIRDSVLEKAREVMELSEALKDDTKELCVEIEQKQSKRENLLMLKLTVVGVMALGIAGGITAPSAWREMIEPKNFPYLGFLTGAAILGYYFIINTVSGNKK
jgi:hypothetical protein